MFDASSGHQHFRGKGFPRAGILAAGTVGRHDFIAAIGANAMAVRGMGFIRKKHFHLVPFVLCVYPAAVGADRDRFAEIAAMIDMHRSNGSQSPAKNHDAQHGSRFPIDIRRFRSEKNRVEIADFAKPDACDSGQQTGQLPEHYSLQHMLLCRGPASLNSFAHPGSK